MEREAGTCQGGKKEKNHFGEISESVNCRLSRTEFLLPQVFFFLRLFFFFLLSEQFEVRGKVERKGQRFPVDPLLPPTPATRAASPATGVSHRSGTPVTVDEAPPTRRPKLLAPIGLPLGIARSVGSDKRLMNDTRRPSPDRAESFRCPQNAPGAVRSSSHLLAAARLSIVPVVLSFLECHVGEVARYAGFRLVS